MTKTQLLKAAEEGRLNDAKRLVTYGVAIDCVDSWNRTPLFLAAQADHEAVVELLIELGATVEVADDFQSTPLMSAT